MTRFSLLMLTRYQTSTAWLSACGFVAVLFALGVAR